MTVSSNQRTLPQERLKDNPSRSAQISAILRYLLLTLLSLVAFAPFILSFLGTFKTTAEITAFPPTLLPEQWNFENWVRVWNFTIPSAAGPLLPRWLFNSAWLAVLNVVTEVFFCSLAGYAFARIRFPGRNVIYALIIASLAIPAAVTLIPAYVFYSNIGWVNTFWPLIVPRLVLPVGILMLTQFFKSIPKELEEAAFMDGLNHFGVYQRIALPLSVPALFTFAIIAFQGSWNDFVAPLLFLQDPELMTLTVGMSFFRFQYTNDLTAILVGAMFNAIPMLVLFFIFNRFYMQSASYSGLAGQGQYSAETSA
ncbi:carbohydrate ABC transporter permease [Candidatus Gracilibacteria bacterium]|nr:carbohydrate ABC transporter permease [Candidatus Gracilibacteria bacterium]